MRLLATFFVLVPLLIDYFSKKYIENNFDTHAIVLNDFIIIDKTYNKGIAFSLFNFDSPLTNIFFSIIVIFIIVIIINFVLKNFNVLIDQTNLSSHKSFVNGHKITPLSGGLVFFLILVFFLPENYKFCT